MSCTIWFRFDLIFPDGTPVNQQPDCIPMPANIPSAQNQMPASWQRGCRPVKPIESGLTLPEHEHESCMAIHAPCVCWNHDSVLMMNRKSANRREDEVNKVNTHGGENRGWTCQWPKLGKEHNTEVHACSQVCKHTQLQWILLEVHKLKEHCSILIGLSDTGAELVACSL